MGWTGTYRYLANPKGAERIKAAIEQEGYFGESDVRKWDVIDSALCGNTVYLAVHFTDSDKGTDIVYGAVILTGYRNGEFFTKGLSEECGPYECDCPKRILDKLSPTDHEFALAWRKRCEDKRKAKASDPLAKLPIGAKIRRKDTGAILTAYQHGRRKVWVDWNTRIYNTPAQLRRIGYEIM